MSELYCCPCECPGKIPQPHHIPGYAGHIPTKKARNGSTFGRMSREVIEDPCVAQAPCPILAPPCIDCCPEDCCMRNPVGCQDIGCCDPVCCPPVRPYQKPRRPPCPELCCDPCQIMKCFPGQSPECCQPNSCCPTTCCLPDLDLPSMTCSQPCAPPPRASCGSPCPPSCPCPVGAINLGSSNCESGRSPCCRPTTPPCPPKRRRPEGCFEQPQQYYGCGPNPAPDCSNYETRAHHLNRGPYCCPCKPDCDNQIYRCCESMSPSYAGHIPGFTFHSTSRTTGKASWGTKQYMNKCFYFNTWSRP